MKHIFPSLHVSVERWKWNDDYKLYVSNFGNLRDDKKKIIKPNTNGGGYLSVDTALGQRLVHRIVMITWNPINNAENLTVDHLDHNKRNNNVKNLEWCTKKENIRRAKKDQVKSIKDAISATNNNHYYCVELNKSFDDIGDVIVFINKQLPYTKTIKEEDVMQRINYAIEHRTKAFTYYWGRIV